VYQRNERSGSSPRRPALSPTFFTGGPDITFLPRMPMRQKSGR
jgi:hypothetical protein